MSQFIFGGCLYNTIEHAAVDAAEWWLTADGANDADDVSEYLGGSSDEGIVDDIYGDGCDDAAYEAGYDEMGSRISVATPTREQWVGAVAAQRERYGMLQRLTAALAAAESGALLPYSQWLLLSMAIEEPCPFEMDVPLLDDVKADILQAWQDGAIPDM